VNDIKILKEMLRCKVRVSLQHKKGKSPSVKLRDKESNATIEIENLPQDSIVIKPETFLFKYVVFAGSKDERRRADFVIVSNAGTRKWIIFIEIKEGKIDEPKRNRVIAQLRGAQCIMDYCKSIGREFWSAKGFLRGYAYRFVGIVDIDNINKEPTRPFQSQGKHTHPDVFLPISGRQSLYFNELI
jgi:hypothetical protein